MRRNAINGPFRVSFGDFQSFDNEVMKSLFLHNDTTSIQGEQKGEKKKKGEPYLPPCTCLTYLVDPHAATLGPSFPVSAGQPVRNPQQPRQKPANQTSNFHQSPAARYHHHLSRNVVRYPTLSPRAILFREKFFPNGRKERKRKIVAATNSLAVTTTTKRREEKQRRVDETCTRARALTHTQGQTRHRGLPINSRIAPGN